MYVENFRQEEKTPLQTEYSRNREFFFQIPFSGLGPAFCINYTVARAGALHVNYLPRDYYSPCIGYILQTGKVGLPLEIRKRLVKFSSITNREFSCIRYNNINMQMMFLNYLT